jgi:hypothetical protein
LSHTVPTVQGPFKVDANGLMVGASQEMVQIQNNVLKLVTPPSLAESKVLVPDTGS